MRHSIASLDYDEVYGFMISGNAVAGLTKIPFDQIKYLSEYERFPVPFLAYKKKYATQNQNQVWFRLQDVQEYLEATIDTPATFLQVIPAVVEKPYKIKTTNKKGNTK